MARGCAEDGRRVSFVPGDDDVNVVDDEDEDEDVVRSVLS